jgi:hypothetical protein
VRVSNKLTDILRIPGPSRVIFRLIEAP